MSSYIDRFANNAEHVNRRLGGEVDIHLARSCFAVLLRNAHTEARSEGHTHEDFRHDIGGVLDGMALPIFFEADASKDLPGKRQPSLRESFDATVDRYAVIDDLSEVFAGSAAAMIYGGSMKYGPFLNVRSGGDASDVDAIIFVERGSFDEIDWRGIMDTDLFEEQDKLAFFARLGLQSALSASNQIDIMSQRFTFADEGYTISTHIMPTDFVEHAYPAADSTEKDKTHHKYVRDYKERPFERTHVGNYDMSRVLHDIPVYNTPTKGGFIAANPAYSVINGRYVPGMYQNLILPNAEFIIGHDSEVADRLRAFSTFVARREEDEKGIDPSSSVLNTEPRKPILPVDVSDILNA